MAAALLRCTGIAVAAARSMSNHSGKRKPCPHNLMNSYLHTEFGSLLGSLAPKRDPCGVVRFLGSLWDSNSVPQEATGALKLSSKSCVHFPYTSIFQPVHPFSNKDYMHFRAATL